MERAITLTTLILAAFYCLACGTTTQHGMPVHHWKPTKFTTRIPLPNKTTLIVPTATSIDKTDKHREHSYYHPAIVEKPRLIERYDKRDLDGHYEYRYVLSNGDVRYERAYWQPVGNTKILARKGYYSYPLPNHRFHTVFYTADHNGFREDESSYSRTQPILPRSLKVPVSVNAVTEGEKLSIEEKKNINRKPNWTATTDTILQKGRFSPIAQEEKINAGVTGVAEAAGAKTKTSTATMKTMMFETSAASTTYRPQINIEVEAMLKKLKIPRAKATTTTAKNESINPIKAESVQTEAMETETEQLETVDTTTVLSVD